MNDIFKVKAPVICLITKGNLTKQNYSKEALKTLEIIKSAIKAKIQLIQIREKELPAKYILELTKSAVEIAKDTDSKVLVNNRVDIALATEADGVHLTSNSIPANIYRDLIPKDFIIGVSTHKESEAIFAKVNGADYVTFSPIFPTTSKVSFDKPKGLEVLKDLCRELSGFPVLALGGINIRNYKKTIEVGAKGVAGISFLNNKAMLSKFAELR